MIDLIIHREVFCTMVQLSFRMLSELLTERVITTVLFLQVYIKIKCIAVSKLNFQYHYIYIYTFNKIINTTLLFLPPFFMS